MYYKAFTLIAVALIFYEITTTAKMAGYHSFFLKVRLLFNASGETDRKISNVFD